MNPTLTVNGVSCDPSNCLVVTPNGTFSGSVFAGDTVLDITYLYQAITPPGPGGTLTVVASVDAPAVMGLHAEFGGVDLNGSAQGSTAFANGRVTDTLTLTIGPSGKTGGDLLAQWLIPPPMTCPPPLIGTPPDCREVPPPPPQVCTPPAVGIPPNCTVPPPPPETCPVPLVGIPPNCMQPPPPPGPPSCTTGCEPPGPPPAEVLTVPTLGQWSLAGLAFILCVAGVIGAYRRSRSK